MCYIYIRSVSVFCYDKHTIKYCAFVGLIMARESKLRLCVCVYRLSHYTLRPIYSAVDVNWGRL